MGCVCIGGGERMVFCYRKYNCYEWRQSSYQLSCNSLLWSKQSLGRQAADLELGAGQFMVTRETLAVHVHSCLQVSLRGPRASSWGSVESWHLVRCHTAATGVENAQCSPLGPQHTVLGEWRKPSGEQKTKRREDMWTMYARVSPAPRNTIHQTTAQNSSLQRTSARQNCKYLTKNSEHFQILNYKIKIFLVLKIEFKIYKVSNELKGLWPGKPSWRNKTEGEKN